MARRFPRVFRRYYWRKTRWVYRDNGEREGRYFIRRIHLAYIFATFCVTGGLTDCGGADTAQRLG